jgi:nucleoside 2-deoxyribosyltransferase
MSIQGFVAMWFTFSMEDVYEKGFSPAIRDSGYQPMRIDRKEHVNKIDDEIIAEIRRSRFLVADFTSEPNQPRGGVYFEAGFALGLNIPVIWTCREDLVGQLHFALLNVFPSFKC